MGNLIFISCITFYILIAFPETPKYLYAKGRFDEARNSLAYVARFNNQPFNKYQMIFDTEKVKLDA